MQLVVLSVLFVCCVENPPSHDAERSIAIPIGRNFVLQIRLHCFGFVVVRAWQCQHIPHCSCSGLAQEFHLALAHWASHYRLLDHAQCPEKRCRNNSSQCQQSFGPGSMAVGMIVSSPLLWAVRTVHQPGQRADLKLDWAAVCMPVAPQSAASRRMMIAGQCRWQGIHKEGLFLSCQSIASKLPAGRPVAPYQLHSRLAILYLQLYLQ